jgi:2-dehydropantoate 2-reductase
VDVAIIGLGVIGTTYGYALQKAGHATCHLVRPSKRDVIPSSLVVSLLDGRKNPKGRAVTDTYDVRLAQPGGRYDMIIVSVSSDKLASAIRTLADEGIDGPVLLMNGITDDRTTLTTLMGGRPFVLGYPVAGGQIDAAAARLDAVLFDHMMLESRAKAGLPQYDQWASAFSDAGITLECPADMLEWIWLHMAINAGVITTAATLGPIDDTAAAARRLMDDSRALALAVRTIRECVQVVAARGIDLRAYSSEIAPYRTPAWRAGIVMKRMFAGNALTRRIMELHANKADLLYVCGSIHNEARRHSVTTPLFDAAYAEMLHKLG